MMSKPLTVETPQRIWNVHFDWELMPFIAPILTPVRFSPCSSQCRASSKPNLYDLILDTNPAIQDGSERTTWRLEGGRSIK